MTKKQYFMLLWGLCSVLPVLMAIGAMGIEKIPGPWYIPIVLVNLCMVLTVIGILLFLGIAFAKKIRIRLFLLDNDIGAGGDLIKSVIFVGALSVIAVLGGIILGVPLGGILLYYLHRLF